MQLPIITSNTLIAHTSNHSNHIPAHPIAEMSFAPYSVPICFGITMAPHFVKVALTKQDNAFPAGRPDVSTLALPKETVARAKRLEAAHLNGLEALGWYSAGVAAAVATGVPAAELVTLCQVHVAARAAYTAIYALPPVAGGILRSLAFTTGVVTSAMIWVAAGRAYQ